VTSGLDRATRVLREKTAVEADGEITRQRIQAAWLRQRARPQTMRRWVAIALGTLVLGGGALAATGVVVRARVLGQVAAPVSETEAEHGMHPVPARADRPSVAPGPPALETAPAPPTGHPSEVAPGSASGAPVLRTAPALPPMPRAPGSSVADASAVYAAAHQAHFVDRHWARALALWSRYLRLAPRGPLAPEAHFNRAICLLHLGRDRDAAAELRGFADGRPGDYRRQEARRLLDAMGIGLPQGPGVNK
jgi:hypothetical protein